MFILDTQLKRRVLQIGLGSAIYNTYCGPIQPADYLGFIHGLKFSVGPI
jgi:hypothetical protein